MIGTQSTRSDPYQFAHASFALLPALTGQPYRAPGLRSMPAWCSYRDAARQEHLAREAQATTEALWQNGAGARISEQPVEGVRTARRGHAGADAQLHGGRQRRGRRRLCRWPPRLCPAGRRRDRLRQANQHFRRRFDIAVATWRCVSTPPSRRLATTSDPSSRTWRGPFRSRWPHQ